MAVGKKNLIWIDLEMTGLAPDRDRIIEMATIVTDPKLNILGEGPVLAIYQDDAVLDAMGDWCQKQHTQSGLVDRVKHSKINEMQAQAATLEFIKIHIPAGYSPMCGNSICQDRRFLYHYMPDLANYFHYRNLDVSTLKELARRWAPKLLKGFKKKAQHLALEDIKESIEELKYYREHFIKL